MESALIVGSIVPMGVGAGCCFRTRHPEALGLIGMTVMVVGMVDAMVLANFLLPKAMWVLLFCAVGLVELFVTGDRAMRLPRAALALTMAVLTFAMPSMGPAPAGVSAHGHVHGNHVAGSGQDWVLGVLGVFVLWTAWALWRRTSTVQRTELVAGAVSVASMAAMSIV